MQSENQFDVKIKDIVSGAQEIIITGTIGDLYDKSTYALVAEVYDGDKRLLGTSEVCPMPC